MASSHPSHAELTAEVSALRARVADLEAALAAAQAASAGLRRAEEQLATEHQQLEILLQTLDESVLALRPDGTISFANDATRRLLPLGHLAPGTSLPRTLDALGLNTFDLAGQPLPMEARPTARALRGERFRNLKVRVCNRATGRERWLALSCSPVPGPDGGLALVVLTGRDVTEQVLAAEALRGSHENLQSLINSTDGLIWSMDAQYRLIVGNERFLTQTSEFLGREAVPGESVLWPELPEVARSLLKSYYDRTLAGEAFSVDLPSLRPGSPLQLRYWFSPIRTAEGAISGLTAFARDITEIVRAQEALRASEARYRTLFDTMTLGVIAYDAEARVTMANPAALGILGLSDAALRARTLGAQGLVVSDEAGAPLAVEDYPIRVALRTGREVRDAIVGVSTTPEGAPRLLRFQALPQGRPGAERPEGVVAIFEDITEARRNERALEAERRQLAAILHTMEEGVIASRPDSSLALINPAAMHLRQLDPHDLPARVADLGKTPHILMDADGRPLAPAERPLLRVMRGEHFVRLELRQRSTVGGEERWFLMNGTPVHDEGGQFMLGLITFKEITERKRHEAELAAHAETLSQVNAELARADRLKDQFLALISHELRTPLNAVLGISEALQEEIYGPITERQRAALATALRSGQALLALLSDVIDLTHLNARTERAELDLVSVDEVVDAAVTRMAARAHDQGVTLTRRIAAGLVALRADQRRLMQVLTNLLDNAVKFTPRGGQVGLEVAADAGREQIAFCVWDTGIGIAAEAMGRLFTPFSQADMRLARSFEGIGLGLALVLQLADLHGGSVRLESTPGQGSRFTVTLPWQAADNTFAPGPAPALSAPAPPWASPPHVLVADDHEETLERLKGLLLPLGCAVTTARSGGEALDQIVDQRPDLALIDLQMPKLDGLSVIRRIRAHDARAALPVIALTALDLPGDRERCLAAGASAYLAKPLGARALVAAIAEVLAGPGSAPR